MPCPSPGDLPDSEIEPWSLLSPPLEGGFFTTGTTFGGIKDFFNKNKLYKRLLYILMLKKKRTVSVKANRNNPLKVSMEKKIAKSDVDETPQARSSQLWWSLEGPRPPQ